MTSFNDLLRASLSRRHLVFGSLTLPLTLLGCGGRRTSEEGVVDLFIQSDGDFLAFKPDELTCTAGALVHLTFHHAGRFLSALHNWVLAYPDQMEAVDKDAEKTDGIISANDSRVIAVVPMCGKGETVMTEFTAPPPGDYPFFCSTPGHAVDMNGILHVTV
ncbi:MAG TPA: plastocyanin/azurin family copper-binding protein [Terriglobia bacterium]|nr:plastocyanin/azurin family copper-binding protein [Terriglobia bacterium]